MTNVKIKLGMLKGSQDKNNVTIYGVPFCIGRSKSADFIIAHVNVSRNHCKIVKENESWKICDFSSSGTYVNDVLVGQNETVTLNNGDRVRFGPLANSLCWTFYSFDSSSDSSGNSDVKQKTRVTLDVCNENFCPKGKDVSHMSDFVLKLEKSTSENNRATETNNFEVTKESQNLKECSHPTKKENVIDNTDCKKIEELTKELQEVQSTLNDLEEKNSALQMELATSVKTNTETFEADKQKNLLEDLADLIETEFQCSICSELLVTAVTLNCTHTFCKFCIDEWKKKQKNCPICRKKIINETRSLVVDNYIDKVVLNLSLELKERREAIIKERSEKEPSKKKSRLRKKNL